MLYDPKWNADTTAARVLLAAADYMDEHGWCQCVMCDPIGRVCIVGAIGAVTDMNTVDELLSALRRIDRHLGMSADRWNDNICKSLKEAVAALRDAAQK